MKIGCLGWGSLIWNPRGLPVRKPWFMDGPLLPIEFARRSGGGRITLVIVPDKAYIRSLWTIMVTSELQKTKEELAEREGIKAKNITEDIGYWYRNDHSKHIFAEEIGSWAAQKGLDAVVWTALTPNFSKDSDNIPTIEEVISSLRSLPYERMKNAEEYIRKAPLQIDTDYRRAIEVELHWTPLIDY